MAHRLPSSRPRGFSSKDPFSPPAGLPNAGIKPASLTPPALAGCFHHGAPPGKPHVVITPNGLPRMNTSREPPHTHRPSATRGTRQPSFCLHLGLVCGQGVLSAGSAQGPGSAQQGVLRRECSGCRECSGSLRAWPGLPWSCLEPSPLRSTPAPSPALVHTQGKGSNPPPAAQQAT